MSSIRSTARITTVRVIAAALAAGALAGCTIAGGASGPPVVAPDTAAPTTTAAPEGPVGEAEEAVAAALTSYQANIAGGDYVLACSQMTAESSAQLLGAVRAGAGAGAVVPGCVEAMAAVLAQPGAADAATEAANTVVVTDVTVQGFSATVRWTSTRQGVPRTDSLSLQQVDLQWRLAGPA